MEEEENPDLSSLHLPTSEFLRINADFSAYDFAARAAMIPGKDSATGSMNLVPKNPDLPSASVSAAGGIGTATEAGISVGIANLRYNKTFKKPPKEVSGSGGGVTTDTVKGFVGPLTGFYEESSQPGNQGSRTTAYGGNMNLGPVDIFANRRLSSQEGVDPKYAQYFDNTRAGSRTDTIGFRGSVPMGQGTLSGGANRQFGTNTGPQQTGQDSRPTNRSPNVTNYDASYQGRVGPGILGLTGRVIDVRGGDAETSASGSYTVENPVGLGGEFKATGEYNNISPEAWLRYKLSF